jgi:hypothetical protein
LAAYPTLLVPPGTGYTDAQIAAWVAFDEAVYNGAAYYASTVATLQAPLLAAFNTWWTAYPAAVDAYVETYGASESYTACYQAAIAYMIANPYLVNGQPSGTP